MYFCTNNIITLSRAHRKNIKLASVDLINNNRLKFTFRRVTKQDKMINFVIE